MSEHAEELVALWQIVDLALYELDELEEALEAYVSTDGPLHFDWQVSKVRGVLLIARRLIATYQEAERQGT
jgi:hypothetical protein